MAVVQGTIAGITNLSTSYAGAGARKSYLVSVNFGVYTGAADTCNIAGVGAAIAATAKNGKTITLRGAHCIAPGVDTNAQAVYPTGTAVQALAVSSDALTGQLSAADGTEVTTSTACQGCLLSVIVDES